MNYSTMDKSNSTLDNSSKSLFLYNREDETTVALLAALMTTCTVATILGNILVVLSVFTYAPLKNVQNYFVVSLASADLAVAILVMPFHIVNYVTGSMWPFGVVVCNAWLTFDILTCTASILHLCVIAIDRYSAIHSPIEYAIKRTHKRVLTKIAIVWLASALISVPPLFGWNNGLGHSLYDRKTGLCQLTDEKSFVVYSALGSFYIPLFIMSFVYVRIFIATRARLRARRTRTPGNTDPSINPRSVTMASRTAVTYAQTDKPGAEQSLLIPLQNLTGLDQPTNKEPVQDRSPLPPVPPNSSVATPLGDEPNNIRATPGSTRQASPELPRNEICETEVDVKGKHSQEVNTKIVSGRKKKFQGMKGECQRKTHEHFYTKTKSKNNNNGVNNSEKSSSQFYKFIEDKHKQCLAKERRAARTMAIIMGAFVLCWLPFFLMYVIFPFCPSCVENTDPRVVQFITWLGYINSTLNPIIYTVFNIDFRHAFRRLLTGNCRSR